MAIVDLVHASEDQLLYTNDLQDEFTKSANQFFDTLEQKAQSGNQEATEIRTMIKGFIQEVNKVYVQYHEENKEPEPDPTPDLEIDEALEQESEEEVTDDESE